MLAPTRQTGAAVPPDVSVPPSPAEPTAHRVDDEVCTPRQKRWALVAAVVVTLLALGRPGLPGERTEPDTVDVIPVSEAARP